VSTRRNGAQNNFIFGSPSLHLLRKSLLGCLFTCLIITSMSQYRQFTCMASRQLTVSATSIGAHIPMGSERMETWRPM
jgi:hypothetical protein